ncbi:MAG: DNA methyltransferase [Candidatus Methanoperedens sp.]|nr:DNA methyltransferase [Candidatus Methanoperedens sp.]
MKIKMDNNPELLTIKQASEWASNYLKKDVTTSNISYLIQYGRIKKNGSDGDTLIAKRDLIKYYQSYLGKREIEWKEQLGEDLNWALSFDNLKETDTTKHVHRLHPYKGKFIPQLVEYFLDDHTDGFKKEVYFKKSDVVLDPFCGSGTTLVQANELGMHSIGIDVSAFNSLISNVKVGKYDFVDLDYEIRKITKALKRFITDSNTVKFENKLIEELAKFNNKYFPSPDYKYKVVLKEINEDVYGAEKEKEFLPAFSNLIKEYNIQLKQEKCNTFLDKWYLQHVRTEIDFVCNLIKQIKNPSTKKVLSIVLSRTVRSCRATTHADLATLKEPVTTTYYCSKHGKICKPLFSILSWWERYSKDTINRLCQFNKLRTETYQICLTGDSKVIDIFEELEKRNSALSEIVKNQKIKGIFSSPPYVGLIDYHDQHAYAYDLFGFERNDELEIGHLLKGQGKEARNSYIEGISEVLKSCKRFLVEDYDIFLVANDKYSLYPIIAENSGMQIVKQYKRPVLNRTERDKGAYSEIIFQLKAI